MRFPALLLIAAAAFAAVAIGLSCAASNAYHPQFYDCQPTDYGCTNPFGPVPVWIGPDGGVRYR